MIHEGTDIWSDPFASYNGLSRLGYVHRIVNHSDIDRRARFITPEGVHTQAIESKWNEMKRIIKFSKGLKGSMLQGYLSSWMWRHNVSEGGK